MSEKIGGPNWYWKKSLQGRDYSSAQYTDVVALKYLYLQSWHVSKLFKFVICTNTMISEISKQVENLNRLIDVDPSNTVGSRLQIQIPTLENKIKSSL